MVGGQLHALATVPPGKNADIHWMGERVGPTVVLDVSSKRYVTCIWRDSNPFSAARSLMIRLSRLTVTSTITWANSYYYSSLTSHSMAMSVQVRTRNFSLGEGADCDAVYNFVWFLNWRYKSDVIKTVSWHCLKLHWCTHRCSYMFCGSHSWFKSQWRIFGV
jgi:hypothetical protein